MREWANVHDLGVKGDDTTDDTAALQRAIDTHRVLYLPVGRYRVTDTLKLRPDSVLISLHPSLTHLYLPDETPAYMGVGGPKALLAEREGRQRDRLRPRALDRRREPARDRDSVEGGRGVYDQ